MRKRANNFFFYDFVKVTGVLPALLFFRPHVTYLNKETRKQLKGKLLIVSNHNSFCDPVIIMSVILKRRIVFLATEELFRTKLGRWFFEHVHCIPVNKQNFNMSTFRLVSAELADNRAVAIFPEGELHEQSDGVKTFKEGAVLMAVKNKAPILPVYISEKRGFRRRVIIGELIKPAEMIEKEAVVSGIKKCSEFLYKREQELAQYYRENS